MFLERQTPGERCIKEMLGRFNQSQAAKSEEERGQRTRLADADRAL
jgi:hypothetical protein